MNDINEIKQKIANGEYTYRPILEAGEMEQLEMADEEILSLITTIESQKEEIEKLKTAIDLAAGELPYGNSAYKILLKSLYPESFKMQEEEK